MWTKFVTVSDICKTFPVEILYRDETKLDSSFPNARFIFLITKSQLFGGTNKFIRGRKSSLHSYRDNCKKVNCL